MNQYKLPDLPYAYSSLEPHISGKTVIVGHTEQKNGEIRDLGCVKCIDTYCYGYRWLTALDVRNGQTWQASRWGVLRDPGETIEGLLRARQTLRTCEPDGSR